MSQENAFPPELCQSLIQEINSSVVLLDKDHQVQFCNRYFLKATGYEKADVLGKNFFEHLVLEQDRERAATRLTCPSTLRARYRILAKSGEILEMSIQPTALNCPDGQTIVGLLGQDITSLSNVEDALRADTTLSTILDTSLDGIVIIEADATVVFFNKGAEIQFGYKAEEVIGKNVSMLMPEPYCSAHDGYVSSYFKTGRAKIIGKGREVIARRKDGSTFPIQLSVGREITLGDRLCFTGFIRDLSREKGIENQLRQAQKMESIGTLAGGIAHDFNNILGGIMGYIDLMLEDTEPGSYLHEDLTEMRNACTRGKDLILQILTFSRQDKTQKIPVQFHPIVSESLKLLRAIIPSNIEIHCHVDKNAPAVMADATQVHQIMMNLCTNAYHAMTGENDIIEVTLEVCMLSEESVGNVPNLPFGKYVALRIRDNGTGMDEGTVARIFDPFFTTKSQGKGTGMGLAVVHGIVQNHGGDILVESETGKGSCFHLFFPAWEEQVEEEEGRTINRPIGRENIMLVDDDQLLLKVQSRILARRGYNVTTFPNGQEALEGFRETPHSYDLVITDQSMPKLTGIELASALVDLREDLPIIITTGFSDVITPDKIASRGIKALLRKPVDGEELTNTVRKILDEKNP